MQTSTRPQSRAGRDIAARKLLTPRLHEVQPNEVWGSVEMLQREGTYRRLLVMADILAVVFFLSAITALGGMNPTPATLLGAPAIVLLCKAAGLYDRDELLVRRSTLDEVPRLFNLATLATLVMWLGQSVLLDGVPQPRVIAVAWFVLLASMVVLRWSAREVAARLTTSERCLVIGDADQLTRLETKIGHDRAIELVGSVPLEHVLHDLGELRKVAAAHRAHRLVLTSPTTGTHEESMNLIRGAKATGLRVSIIPGILEVVGSSVEFDHLPGLTLLGVKRFGLTRSSRSLKRSFDLIGASIALLAFSPFMIVAALAVKFTSPGPILFRQTRVGRNGKQFEIFKFRTMVDGADAMRAELAAENEATDGLFKIAADPRITTVGRILRKTSLDELPQLLNVMRGEMSLVGPRPLVVYEDEQVTGFDRRRLVLTPGMTGPWQVASGSDRVSMSEMVKMDYIYVASWSLWNDVKICARTCRYMLSARGQ